MPPEITNVLTFIVYGFAAFIMLRVLLLIFRRQKKKNNNTQKLSESGDSLSCQKIPMLSENERRIYRQIKSVTDELNLHLFTKVKLSDLIEPTSDGKNYQGIQILSKNADFVICDKDLNAKVVLILRDTTKNRMDKQDREILIDAALKTSGYNVIHIIDLNVENLKSALLNIAKQSNEQ